MIYVDQIQIQLVLVIPISCGAAATENAGRFTGIRITPSPLDERLTLLEGIGNGSSIVEGDRIFDPSATTKVNGLPLHHRSPPRST